ncbi:MAG: TatD family hydrolase [Planctomycetes bacterium]|nr:TatD family hydrolase [Planctomycetota bacterium]
MPDGSQPKRPALFDSHCHLTSGKFAGRVGEVLQAARDVGVGRCLTAGTSVADSTAAMGIARRHDGVMFSAGVHPHEAKDAAGDYLDRLADLAAAGASRCAAIGEIGLDYHYDFSPRDVQRRVFDEQLDLAGRLGKPVILHAREATADMLAALAPRAGTLRGVVHSFTGDADEVRRYLDQGWFIGFAGIVTFKGAQANRQAARLVPADRLLIETDAPYLSPEPVRKVFPNVPAHVVHTAALLAELRGVAVEDLARTTTANAAALFGLDREDGRL